MEKIRISFFLFIILIIACEEKVQQSETTSNENMMVRIAEIEIDSVYFDDYITILKEEAAKSVELEKGVLCIFPMYQKENPTQIRLLEIYASQEAYEAHLKTPHFSLTSEITSSNCRDL